MFRLVKRSLSTCPQNAGASGDTTGAGQRTYPQPSGAGGTLGISRDTGVSKAPTPTCPHLPPEQGTPPTPYPHAYRQGAGGATSDRGTPTGLPDGWLTEVPAAVLDACLAANAACLALLVSGGDA